MAMATKRFLFLALIILGLVCVIKGQRRGTVRLVRNGLTSTSYSSGRVQVYGNGWGHICDDLEFASTESDVICHQLGYSGALSYSRSALDSYGVDDSSSFLMSNVDCSTSDYLVILQCSYYSYVPSSCEQNSDEVSVNCWSTRIWDNPYNSQVRLSQGTYTSQGLVEVYCNGQWGTVCDDFFGLTEANTVCKQLGYTGAAAYDNLTPRGSSSQPIWLDDVYCGSSSNCIHGCQACPSHEHSNCGHSEDITVECEYGTIENTFTQQSTCNFNSASDDTSDFTSSTISNVSGSAIVVIGIILTVIFLVLPVAIPLSICACIVVAVTSTRRNRRRTAYRAVPTSPPPAPPTIAVSASMDSYQPVNQPFYPIGMRTLGNKPPPYTPRDPTSIPAQPSGGETPAAVNPLPTTSNVV